MLSDLIGWFVAVAWMLAVILAVAFFWPSTLTTRSEPTYIDKERRERERNQRLEFELRLRREEEQKRKKEKLWEQEQQQRNQQEARAQQARQREQERKQREQEQARRREEKERETRQQQERPNDRRAKSRDTNAQDWWMVLGIAPEATFETAKRAYLLKIKQYHPDRVTGLGPEFIQLAELKSKELNRALDQAKRYART